MAAKRASEGPPVPARYADASERVEATVDGISADGGSVVGYWMRPVGMSFRLAIPHPVTKSELLVDCKVRRVRSAPGRMWRLDVRFEHADESERERVSAFVSSLRSAARPAGESPAEPAPVEPAPAVPAAPARAAVDEWVAGATEASLARNHGEAVRCVDQALALEPSNAELHWLRARFLSSDPRRLDEARAAAKRATEISPRNRIYAALVETLEGRHDAVSPARPTPVRAPSRSPHAAMVAAFVGVLLLAGQVGWVLASGLRSPSVAQIDPRPYSRIVPLRRVQVLKGRIYATVGPGWNEISDKPSTVLRLAQTIRRDRPADDLLLADEGARMVATVRRDAVKIYAPAGGDSGP